MCTKQAKELVLLAADGLVESARDAQPNERFADAQLAALRAAAAVVAQRGNAAGETVPRNRVSNVWQLLARLAPELSEWAALFDMSAAKRSAVQAGVSVVSTREADDCLRDAASFVSRVARLLGLPAREVDVSTQWLVAT
jgi:hypothetical protein